MIISRLCGGLGNQMFQYAIARSVADRLNDELLLDLSYYDSQGTNTIREYTLKNFNIRAGLAKVEGYQKLVIPKWKKKLHLSHKGYIAEKTTNKFEADILSLPQADYYFDGYWQTESYFCDNRSNLIKDFSLKTASDNLVAAKMKLGHNALAVHFRRGDYVKDEKTNSHHGVCSLDYYQQAIELMRSKKTVETILVFSDDCDWVRDNFKTDLPVVYAEDFKLSDCEELILMSGCDNFVIANSSFSWWGAWLADGKQKDVIAPGIWNASGLACEDVVPKAWLKL